VVLGASVVGALLLVRYLVFDAGLPRGGIEFDYHIGGLAPALTSPTRGFTPEQLAAHVARLALLGPALLLLVFPVERLLAGASPDAVWRRRLVGLAATGALFTAGWLMFGVLRGRPLIEDELTYRLQAALFADGRLGDPLGVSWPRPGKPFTIWTPEGTTGKYLFGEPLVQVVGVLVGYPALLHLPLAALAIWAFRRSLAPAGDAVRDWATLLLAISPMFVFTTAVGLSNITSFTMLAVALAGYVVLRERLAAGAAVAWPALVVGVALGFGLTARIQAVGPGGVVVGVVSLALLLRARRWVAAALLVGSGLVFVFSILLYNRALTGSAWVLPWMLYTPVEQYGFGPVWEGRDIFTHTPWTALENLAVSAVRFNGWWLGWPVSLGMLAAWWRLGRPTTGAAPHLWVGAGILLFNLGWFSPGVSDTGPVYYLELLLPACALGGHALAAAATRWPGWTAAVLAVHIVVGTGTFYGEQAARLARLADYVNATAEDVLSRLPPPALLLVETRTGEARPRGWVWSGFSRWDRRPGDPVVVYPRESAENARALQAAFPDRSCWYFRTHPRTGAGEFGPCELQKERFERP
jgi:hypothetical protein